MKSKGIKIFSTILMTMLIIAGLFYIIKYNVQAVNTTGSGSGKVTSNGVQKTMGAMKNTGTGLWEALPESQNSFMLPTYAGYEIYCINPASALRYGYEIRYNQRYNGQYSALEYKAHVPGGGEIPYKSSCGCASTIGEGLRTPPVYKEYDSGELSPAASYIVTEEPLGSWSEEKQKAIWNLRWYEIDGKSIDWGLIVGDGRSINDGPSIYDQEAIDYAKYASEMEKNKQQGKEGLAPEDKTNIDNVYTKVDTTQGSYSVGPLNIKYTNATYGDISFGGISEIYVIGYNQYGEEAPGKEKIKVDKIAIGSEEKEPEYFEADNMLVDETEQVYPKSEEDFDIVFEDPNSDLDPNDPLYDQKYVTKIKIKIKFQYMFAKAGYTKLQGIKYTVAYGHTHDTDHTHTCHHYDVERKTQWMS